MPREVLQVERLVHESPQLSALLCWGGQLYLQVKLYLQTLIIFHLHDVTMIVYSGMETMAFVTDVQLWASLRRTTETMSPSTMSSEENIITPISYTFVTLPHPGPFQLQWKQVGRPRLGRYSAPLSTCLLSSMILARGSRRTSSPGAGELTLWTPPFFHHLHIYANFLQGPSTDI